jgi:hypothetical protein
MPRCLKLSIRQSLLFARGEAGYDEELGLVSHGLIIRKVATK